MHYNRLNIISSRNISCEAQMRREVRSGELKLALGLKFTFLSVSHYLTREETAMISLIKQTLTR